MIEEPLRTMKQIYKLGDDGKYTTQLSQQ